MAGTPEQARENGKLGGRPVGAKGWKTIEKEKLRMHYEEVMRKNFAELIDIHVAEAKKLENTRERQYAIDQSIGKPVEKIEMEQTTTLKVDI